MKHLILSLALFAGSAFAFAPPQEVQAECVKQMAAGVCSVRPDRASIAPDAEMHIAGVGRVQYSAYLDYMDKYNLDNPSDPAMCDLALGYMQSAPGSDHDKVARALWTPSSHEDMETYLARQAEEKKTTAMAATAVVAGVMLAIAALFVRRRRSWIA